MRKANIILCAVLVITTVLSGCKKGPDDPFISLKTRKARLGQRWVMTHGNVALSIYYKNSPPDLLSYEFDGSSGLVTNSYNTAYSTLKYTLSIEFTKSGKFSMSENLDGIMMNASGFWNFGGKIGNHKKKEDVYIKLDNVTTSDTRDHFFNHFSAEVSYNIEQLSHDELHMHASTNYYISSTGEKGVIESNYTFKH